MSERPALPSDLRRRVLVEAGHRCAIPTCRQHPVDVHHIVEWSAVREHTFDNLIALCPTCHRRMREKDIDRRSAQQYKANLTVLNSRYEPHERRLLLQLAGRGDGARVVTAAALTFLFGNLLADGLVEESVQRTGEVLGDVRFVPHQPELSAWTLTAAGQRLADRMLDARPLDEDGA